jgi:peptidoglycan-N-acetylglucosamine deacetylase
MKLGKSRVSRKQRYIFARRKHSTYEIKQFIYPALLGFSGIGILYWSFGRDLFANRFLSTSYTERSLLLLPQQNLSSPINIRQASVNNLVVKEAIPVRFQQKTLKEVYLPKQDKIIALTFDDGPWPVSTKQILDILKKENVKATFFVVGRPLKNYPQVAQQVVAQGHAIGNHTWHHLYQKLDAKTSAREIEDTTNLIYKTTGVKTSLFRPPGGLLNNGVVDYAKQKKYFIALWSADSTDYNRPSVGTLVHKVIKNARPGGMILMHDGGGDRSTTVKALPIMITQLRNRGYKFVTVPELLEIADMQSQIVTKP